MTNDHLQDAIGLVDERYIAEMYGQLATCAVRQRKRLRWVSSAASLLLVLGLGVWGMLAGTDHLHADADFSPPVDLDLIIWGQPSNLETTIVNSLTIINGWYIDGNLARALEGVEADTYIAIEIRKRYDPTDRMNFLYQGKTRGQWEVERDCNNRRFTKLAELQKEGEWLKYGEAIYTTGTPNGERWSKELYEDRLNYYGAYFLSQYIEEGEFLADKAAADLATVTEAARNFDLLMVDLEDAYRAACAAEMLPVFKNTEILCGIRNDALYMFVTKDELMRLLPSADKEAYLLCLAPRRVFESADEPIATVDKTLTGFACEKISFYTDGVRYDRVTSDAEVIEAANYLLDRWHYKADHLFISIYADSTLSDAELTAMNFEIVYRSTYIDLIMLRVPMKDFNLTAVRDLSLLPQVSSIHIGPTQQLDTAG